jgi:hydrogenase nickel incorporation protein HypA/HybF
VHETKLCLALLELATRQLEAAGAARIVAVRLELGELAGVAAEALEATFPICAAGTAADGARLVIERAPGRDLVLRDMEVT